MPARRKLPLHSLPSGFMNNHVTSEMLFALACGMHVRLGAQSIMRELPEILLRVIVLGGQHTGCWQDPPVMFERDLHVGSLRRALVRQCNPAATLSIMCRMTKRSLGVRWLRSVFDYMHYPCVSLYWMQHLDFGTPTAAESKLTSKTRAWEHTRLLASLTPRSMQEVTAEIRKQTLLPFGKSARAATVLSSRGLVFVNRKPGAIHVDQMQSLLDNYWELFWSCTRRFKACWLSASDLNSCFTLSEPRYEDLNLLGGSEACSEDRECLAAFVLQCLQQIWGKHNCDLHVRLRTTREGLQIFVFGRGLIADQVLTSDLFKEFRAKVAGQPCL